jgi:predicted DNA-binding antitoxin AbrB/MazE fold protein
MKFKLSKNLDLEDGEKILIEKAMPAEAKDEVEKAIEEMNKYHEDFPDDVHSAIETLIRQVEQRAREAYEYSQREAKADEGKPRADVRKTVDAKWPSLIGVEVKKSEGDDPESADLDELVGTVAQGVIYLAKENELLSGRLDELGMELKKRSRGVRKGLRDYDEGEDGSGGETKWPSLIGE